MLTKLATITLKLSLLFWYAVCGREGCVIHPGSINENTFVRSVVLSISEHVITIEKTIVKA
jgi:hypothetical protein